MRRAPVTQWVGIGTLITALMAFLVGGLTSSSFGADVAPTASVTASEPSPSPAFVKTLVTWGLTANTTDPTSTQHEIKILSRKFTWEVVKVETQNGTTWVGDPDNTPTVKTVTIKPTVTTDDPTTTMTGSFSTMGLKRITVKVTVVYTGTEDNNPKTWTATGTGYAFVRISCIFLAIDSNNDGKITPQDYPIKNDPSLPGKIILTNRLDRTGDGVPGFADGIDLFGNSGDNRSSNFAPLELFIPASVDLSTAKVKFEYSGADPAKTTKTNATPFPIYDPNSPGAIRIWDKNGSVSRKVANITGNPKGDYVSPGIHDASTVFHSGSVENGVRKVTLFVEGINETQPGKEQIRVALDPTGTGNFDCSDAVRYTVAWLQIVYTDVTGLGDPHQATIPRIPPTIQPNGTVCDWLAKDKDGALLLMRVVGSPVLFNLLTKPQPEITIQFGMIPQTNPLTFTALPGGIKQEGEYRNLSDASFVNNATAALSTLNIDSIGKAYAGTSRIVLDARFYKPPLEFDLTNPLNPAAQRKVNLAVRLQGVVQAQGAEANKIQLTRTPVVLVHGVNSNPSTWDTWTKLFDKVGYQGKLFKVNHSGPDPQRPEEGDTLGFGEITHMYTFVAAEVQNAVKTIQNDANFAVKRVDVIGHSYGGLLIRWYVERAGKPIPNTTNFDGSEFDARKNVRKVITLATPHKGTPLGNMICNAFPSFNANDKGYPFHLISEARIEPLRGSSPTLAGFLNALDIKGYQQVGPIFQIPPALGVLQGQLPTSLNPQRTAPRHAFQIASVNSERIFQLNEKPFRDDVAYAAVVGTNQNLIGQGGIIEFPPYRIMEPRWHPADFFVNLDFFDIQSRNYFPWLFQFNPRNTTDFLVPIWSARLGEAKYNSSFTLNHGQVQTDAKVFETVHGWLNDPGMPKGDAQRTALIANKDQFPPVSDRNAYQGSRVIPDATSRFAGLKPLAIVKVDTSGVDPFTATYSTLPNRLGGFSGIRPVLLTGMIQQGRIGGPDANFTVVQHDPSLLAPLLDTVFDSNLNRLGVVAKATPTVQVGRIRVPPADLDGAGPNDYLTFQVLATIGRRHNQIINGPSGPGSRDGTPWVGYDCPLLQDRGQSPPTTVTLPPFQLPRPTPQMPAGVTLPVVVTGTVETENAVLNGGKGTQVVNILLIAKRGTLQTNVTLEVIQQQIPHPVPEFPAGTPLSVWNGLLIPYSFTSKTLFIDQNGFVAGVVNGQVVSSKLKTVGIFQQLNDPAGVSTNSPPATLPP